MMALQVGKRMKCMSAHGTNLITYILRWPLSKGRCNYWHVSKPCALDAKPFRADALPPTNGSTPQLTPAL